MPGEWLVSYEEARGEICRVAAAAIYNYGIIVGPDDSAREIEAIALEIGHAAQAITKLDGLAEQAKTARTTIPEWLRTRVLERDEFRCLNCHSGDDLAVDHVVPLVSGGSTSIDNLQVLCRSCNSRKGTDSADYRPYAHADDAAELSRLR